MKIRTQYSRKIKTAIVLSLLAFSLPMNVQAQEAQQSSVGDLINNSSLLLTAFVLVIMLAAIIGLARISINLSKGLNTFGKKSSATIILLLITASTFAQTTPAAPNPTATQFPAWAMNSNLYLFGFLFLIMLISIIVLLRANMQLIKALSPKQEITEVVVALEEEKAPSLLRKFYLWMVDSVPVEKEKDVLLDHDYDGIHELDNNLPPWWKYGFYFTIIFGIVYLINYHVMGSGQVQLNEYNKELAVAAQEKEARMKASSENVNEANVVLLTDADAVNNGKETFMKLCAACHRTDAGGQVGPNLTDEYWLHGGGIKNVFTTITEGVPAKGMISWKSQLSPKQIQQVGSYILSLKGSNPVGPKEPQGDKWVETTIAPADSLAKTPVDSTKSGDKITSQVK